MDSYQNPASEIFNEPAPLVYAGFWERVGAAVLDGLILAVPTYFLSWLFGYNWFEAVGRNAGSFGYSFAYFKSNFVGEIIGWLYYALQESSPAQATLGKRALNIKVVGNQGQRISFLNATGRHFAKIISLLICCVGYLFPLWDKRRQALHDKIAGTFVVNA